MGWGLRSTQGDGLLDTSNAPMGSESPLPNVGNVPSYTCYTQKGKLSYKQVKQEQEKNEILSILLTDCLS